MIFDTDRIVSDAAYREDMRHRFETDHFFAAQTIGFPDFSELRHRAAVDLYFPKNRLLPIKDQHQKKKRLHLDPRRTFKTTLKRVERAQWIAAFPETITILNVSATQPLAEEVSVKTAGLFYRAPGEAAKVLQLMYPELVTDRNPQASPNKQRWVWNTLLRRGGGAVGDLDSTLAYTSPKSTQSGWHPLMLDFDDVEDTNNSGIGVTEEVRQGVINTCDQNENLLGEDDYMSIGGTRYHPFDYYSTCLKSAEENPDNWVVLVRGSRKTHNGARLLPGEFPREEDCELLFPEFLSYNFLREKFHKNYESFMCFPAGSPVLMADWTEKVIEDLQIGDEVVGFNSGLERATIKAVHMKRGEVIRATTNTGRVILTTPDHEFLEPTSQTHRAGQHYGHLEVGAGVVSVYTCPSLPTPEEQRVLDWLGGLLDGEGTINSQGIRLYQSEKNVDVCGAIRNALAYLNIPFVENRDARRGVINFLMHGGRSLRIRLAQHCRMSRRNRLVETLWKISKMVAESSGRGGGTSDEHIVSIESIGENLVYDITTSTSNYVCQGFAAHNCQQMNDPQGGAVPVFDEKLYASCLVALEKIPFVGHSGEVFTCWRVQYGGKSNMAKFTEGAAAKVIDGKVYVIDTWQTTRTPTGLAEMMVQEHKRHQADGMMILDTPGSEFMTPLVRNEAARRNVSIRIHRPYWEEDDSRRASQIKSLEPLMRVGRLLFSTAMTKAAATHSQFVHFGLVEENGIIDCINQFAQMVPMSQMRANMQEEELEYQRKQRDNALVSGFLEQQGMPIVDDQVRMKAQAHLAAMSRVQHNGMPPLPGGLDG